jgi:hypothetical protein
MTTIFLTLMRGLISFISMSVMGFLKGAMKMKAVQSLLTELEAEILRFEPAFGGAVRARRAAAASNGGVGGGGGGGAAAAAAAAAAARGGGGAAAAAADPAVALSDDQVRRQRLLRFMRARP